MGLCCQDEACQNFEGMSASYKRILVVVGAINLLMFMVETFGGKMAGSVALQADALDFLADFVTYTGSLLVIGRPLRLRANVALLKGLSLAVMGIYVFGSTIYRMFVLGVPEVMTMSAIGFLALATNVTSVLLLYRWRNGDANVRSVWLCSRNDAIGNVAVLIAAALVAWTGTGWPDVIVAAIMAWLFLNSSWQIMGRALGERRLAHEGMKQGVTTE